MKRLSLSLLLFITTCAYCGEKIYIVKSPDAAARVNFGIDKLRTVLKNAGCKVAVLQAAKVPQNRPLIIIGTQKKSLLIDFNDIASEGFVLESKKDITIIAGGDDSGTLYGCMELADRIRKAGVLPKDFRFTDKPAMVLRGTCIGMQKTQLLPGRGNYEYPYTPENFPFFYDKKFWQEYLDLLAENRMNTLYLWNGHPFASLVKLKDYPYALEVSEQVYKKNVEMFEYLTQEADRRGIWVVQMFYNIYVSKPFAEKNGISTQLKEPTPLAADYNRKSIAAFVEKYPNVGLLVCLGEALRGIENQTEWFTKVVIPGVQDGMKQLGITKEPPIILRAHATDPNIVIQAALPIYKNLYTMAKYNGESLTTDEPRGRWQQVNLNLSRLGSRHISNVHILANLEPFRYGAQRFIQRCVKAMQTRLGAQGLHLYPLCYWYWPYSPDNAEPKLKQHQRDWIWFEAWARYAWNPDRDEKEDREYWISRLTDIYGDKKAAGLILDAYNDAGECAPRLIRRFGITEGNRQTLSLGMRLEQLVNPEPFKPFPDLWLSQAPPGERLQEYAEKEWNHLPHTGETPPQIIQEVLEYSQKAVEEIEAAKPLVTKNREEFDRLYNDIHCIQAMSENYAFKADAAILVLRYNFSKDVNDMKKAEEYLEKSLISFRKLVELTRHTYIFAQSMQTKMRKIPYTGFENDKPANFYWMQVLGKYEKELDDFQHHIYDLETGKSSKTISSAKDWMYAER
ncbi:MAG: hypothetical protein WCE45_07475 [Sedimentisphaerales bacterium]